MALLLEAPEQHLKSPPQIDLTFHRQQELVLTHRANEILYGGAAGGGKSHGIRASMIYFCIAIPGLFCALFRRSFPELIRNHLTGPGSFHALLAPLVKAGYVRIVNREIRFWNGSQIILSHMQHEKNIYDWQGAEIHYAAFDELTHFGEKMYRYIRARCRLGGLVIPAQFEGMFPRILSGSNPGGVGHNWVKKAFVNNGPYQIIKTEKEEGGMNRVYIPARLADNPTQALNDPEYESKLHGLGDATLVRAMLDGDWSIATGAMWGDVWRHDLHSCNPFSIPLEWKMWRGGDDGFAAPASVLWGAEDPNTKTIYVIDELYRAGMLPDVMAERVLHHDGRIIKIDHNGNEEPNREKLGGILDSAAFGDTGQQNAIPRGHVMNKLGCRWKPSEKWPGSRVAGVQHIHRMLATNPATGRPFLQVFRTCRMLMEVLPTIPRDKNNPEDVDGDFPDDHCFVAGTMIQTPAGPVPVERLAPGDMVTTRFGAFPVAANWITKGRSVITNMGLTGTPDHKVWTSKGYKKLAKLTRYDTLCICPKEQKTEWKLSNTVGSSSAATLIHPGQKLGITLCQAAAIECAASEDFTRRFTRTLTAQFLKECTSITKTKTLSTILRKIWKSSHPKNTSGSIFREEWISSGKTSKEHRRRLLSGIEARLAESGTGSTPSGLLPAWLKRIIAANSAEWNSAKSRLGQTFSAEILASRHGGVRQDWTTSPSHAPCAARNSPATNIQRSSHAQNPAECGCHTADVYNLTIDGPAEYFANGLLVSNCIDSLRYLLLWKGSSFQRLQVMGT